MACQERFLILSVFLSLSVKSEGMQTVGGSIIINTIDDLETIIPDEKRPTKIMTSVNGLRNAMKEAVNQANAAAAQTRTQTLQYASNQKAQLRMKIQEYTIETQNRIKQSSANYRQATTKIIREEIDNQNLVSRKYFSDERQKILQDVASDLAGLEEEAQDKVNEILKIVDDSIDNPTSANRLAVLGNQLDTEFKDVENGLKVQAARCNMAAKINLGLSTLQKKMQSIIGATLALMTEKLNPENLMEKKVRIWVGGCSYHGGGGWQSLCYDRLRYDTMNGYAKPENRIFRIQKQGIFRMTYKIHSHCWYNNHRILINGQTRHYGRDQPGSSRHKRAWWGDGHIDMQWPLKANDRVEISLHRYSGSHNWHSWTDSGYTYAQYVYMGSY